jgi:long-chain acyl-CoA synthetase
VRASLLDTLDDFERWGEECAYVFPRGYRHERWSYGRVAGVAYQFARELEARKIAKGDAVVLWSENCAEWVAAFLGCALCGVVVVPVDDGATPDFARKVSAQVKTRLVICRRERAVSLGEAGTSGERGEGMAILDPRELAGTIAQRSSERFRPAEILPADPLEIVFTSGTTAEPKGVVLSHANVVGNLAPIESEIGKYLKYERFVHPIRFLNLLPLSHVFGQFLGIFLPPLLGGTVVFADTFNPTEVMTTIHRERVSVLVAVPRMIESLKQKVERDLEGSSGSGGRESHLRKSLAERLSASDGQHFLRRWWSFRDVRRRFGWKFWAMISGGAALDRETEEFWHRLGYAVVQGYGLTETTSLISLNHPFHTSRGSIGKVLPGREMKLADDGEILVRGSGVASGYWNGREVRSVANEGDDGWYRTGDLGALDEQGNLYFKGRKKEVIVTPGGMNIYPQDLEAALRKQAEVRDCLVIGLERGGNAEACAVLILRDRSAGEARAREVVARANATLAEYQRMRTWFVWPEEDFPRSATQKPRRNAIAAAVEASLAGRPVENTASPLRELLTSITGRAPQNFSPDANLESGLGLSSLERVELLSALEDRYQIDLSETSFANVATVGDLERLLQGQTESGATAQDIGSGGRAVPDATRDRGDVRGVGREQRRFHYPRWTLRWPTTWLRLVVHYGLARPAMLLLGWPRVIGRENLRGVRGPLLVVSNHVADVDIGFIQVALPARIRHKLATATRGEDLERLRSPAASRGLLRGIYDRLQWVLGVSLLNLFPLPREAGFRKSFGYAGEAVDRGYSILVFPEGKHSTDGAISTFRSGVGLLANNLRVPVLPMRIDGLFEIKKAGKKFAAPGKIQVRIGKPIQFVTGTDPEEIASTLQNAVETLGQ